MANNTGSDDTVSAGDRTVNIVATVVAGLDVIVDKLDSMSSMIGAMSDSVVNIKAQLLSEQFVSSAGNFCINGDDVVAINVDVSGVDGKQAPILVERVMDSLRARLEQTFDHPIKVVATPSNHNAIAVISRQDEGR